MEIFGLLTDSANSVAHLDALPVDAGLRLRALGADDTLRLTGGG